MTEFIEADPEETREVTIRVNGKENTWLLWPDYTNGMVVVQHKGYETSEFEPGMACHIAYRYRDNFPNIEEAQTMSEHLLELADEVRNGGT